MAPCHQRRGSRAHPSRGGDVVIAPWRDPLLIDALAEARAVGLWRLLAEGLVFVALIAALCALTVVAWAGMTPP